MNKKTIKIASIFLCFILLYQNSVIAFATENARQEQIQDSSYSLETINITEPPVEIPLEIPTEPATAPALEAPTEIPTEPNLEVPTEIPTEPNLEVPTEMPSKPNLEVPTEIPSEPNLEVPTEMPSEEIDLIDPPTIPEDENKLVDDENELDLIETPPVDLNRYSASIYWAETQDAQPNFSYSPAWNPETHSYDQWEFTANSPLVVQNTSEGSTVINVEIFFQSNIQAHRQLTLSPYETGEDSLIVILAAGEKKNIYLSISSTEPMLEVTDEVCVGMISYRITAAVSADENGQFSEVVTINQPVSLEQAEQAKQQPVDLEQPKRAQSILE